MELTFNLGAAHKGTVLYSTRLSTKKADDILQNVKVPSELRRRRLLDFFPVYKAAELRNLVLFFFPAIIDSIPDDRPQLKEMWLSYIYLVRAYTCLNDEELAALRQGDLDKCMDRFQELHQTIFGPRNATYNLHGFLHLKLIRKTGPTTTSSALQFENVYAITQRCYVAGTRSTGKQLLQNFIARNKTELNHRCYLQLSFSDKATPLTDDTLCFHKRTLSFVRIKTFVGTDAALVQKLKTRNYFHLPLRYLSWAALFVKSYQGEMEGDQFVLPLKELTKALMVANVLTACPTAVAHEGRGE